MSKDVRISPLGNFAVQLYKENITFEQFHVSQMKLLTGTLMTVNDFQFANRKIYDQAVVYSKKTDEFRTALHQVQTENEESIKNGKSRKRVQKQLDKEYKDYVNNLRECTNDWLYNFGSRNPKRYADKKRRAIYCCNYSEIHSLVTLAEKISMVSKNTNLCYRLFFYIMTYSVGEFIELKYNAGQEDVTLSDSIEKFSENILPYQIQTEIPEFDFKKHTLYIYRGMIGCFKNKHHLAGVNAIVPTANGVEVLLNAAYCADCDRFYISYSEYMYYLDKYKSLLTKFVLTDSILSDGVFGKLADQSPLRLCGYSVSQEKGLSKDLLIKVKG